MTPRSGWEAYEPLVERPALFRQFADLTPGEAGFQEFACDYGGLGLRVALEGGGASGEGEPLSGWLDEWRVLRNVVDVLDAVRRSDTGKLQQWTQVDKHRALFVRRSPVDRQLRSVIAVPGDEPWRMFVAGDTKVIERSKRLAMTWVQLEINKRLGDSLGPPHVRSRVLFDPDQHEYGIYVVPRSLLGALWLQCALTIEQGLTHRRCEQCGKWILLSPEGPGRRRHTRYCTNGCRLKNWRERQRRLKRGKSPHVGRVRERRATSR